MAISDRSECANNAFGGFKVGKIKYVKIYGLYVQKLFLSSRIGLKLPSIDSESKTTPYMSDRKKSAYLTVFGDFASYSLDLILLKLSVLEPYS